MITASASTATSHDHATRYAQGGMPLGMAVRAWPTPTARDYKDGQYTPNVPINSLLGRFVWKTPTAMASSTAARYSPIR